MPIERFIANRAKRVKESGIRRIFNLAASLKNPVNFSIGQPDFGVPEAARRAAIAAIQAGDNGYTVTQGLPALRAKVAARLAAHYPEPASILITSGLSGGLLLALMATLNPGDEVLYADPYFVSYPNLVQWLDGVAVHVPSYPGFQLPVERIAQAITPQSKILLLNSPNNPTGVVYDRQRVEALCSLAERHDLLIISDEIYCDLSYDGDVPSPIEFAPQRTLLLRGFSKSYAMTGWRMGFAAGPPEIIAQMGNIQQYTFVCAPSIAQHGAVAALDTDLSGPVSTYARKRDRVATELQDHFEFTRPAGGFYFFLKAPPSYASGTAFVEAALERNLLCVPGCVFSDRDTHVRISYAVDDEAIEKGCRILRGLVPC